MLKKKKSATLKEIATPKTVGNSMVFLFAFSPPSPWCSVLLVWRTQLFPVPSLEQEGAEQICNVITYLGAA